MGPVRKACLGTKPLQVLKAGLGNLGWTEVSPGCEEKGSRPSTAKMRQKWGSRCWSGATEHRYGRSYLTEGVQGGRS